MVITPFSFKEVMGFDAFNDQNKDGTNVNITDPTDPTKKANVNNGELSVSDVVNTVATPIHTSVGTTAVRIDNPTLANRKEVIVETPNKTIYIGFDNTVTSSTYAHRMRKGEVIDFIYGPSVELWAISDSAGGISDAVVTQGAA
jgi:hypothetical protein